MIIHEFNLDIIPGGGKKEVHLSQYDEDFILKITLYARSGIFTIANGTTVAIRGTKPDGSGFSADGSINGNTVTIVGDQQMTAVAGRAVFEITLHDGNSKELSSMNFFMIVERAALDADTIQSESVLRELDAIIDGAETATQAAGDAADAADRAEEAVRTLTIDGTLTQAGQAADAKKTGDEISNLKGDLKKIKPGLSNEAKTALLACFENVGWEGVSGYEFIRALRKALTDTLVVSNTELANRAMWYQAYPYYVANNTRLSYSKLDIPAIGGNAYRIDTTVLQSAILMRIDIYNQNILDSYASESNINIADRVTLVPWSNTYDHKIVIPKYINNSPAAGMVFIFAYSANTDISNEEVGSIVIEEMITGIVPSGYTTYDYIAVNRSTNVTVGSTEVITTDVYDNLAHANISLDYLATNNIETSNAPIIGVRSENDWAHTVCIYITSAKDYTIHSHGSKVIEDAVTKSKINHIDLKQESASPSIFVANEAKTEITWSQDNTVYAPMYLFTNGVYNITTGFPLSANVQLGQFVIWEEGNDPDIYVPVVRNSDNVIGIYNTTKQKFYTCSDTTKAKVGQSNSIYRVGNWQ